MLTLVVKLGGEVVASPELPLIADDLRALVAGWHRVALVHGGGPQASALQRRLGLEPRIVGGKRVTDEATLDVMKYTVAGQVNVDLCAALLARGVMPVGLHGASGHVIQARRRPPGLVTGAGPEPVDLGLVGDVTGFNLGLLSDLQERRMVPVLACLGCDRDGQPLNINGDTVASQLAGALRADALVLVTATPGVLRDVKDPSSRIPRLARADFERGLADGSISGGMIPKLEESFAVLAGGARSVVIVGKLGPGDLAPGGHRAGQRGDGAGVAGHGLRAHTTYRCVSSAMGRWPKCSVQQLSHMPWVSCASEWRATYDSRASQPASSVRTRLHQAHTWRSPRSWSSSARWREMVLRASSASSKARVRASPMAKETTLTVKVLRRPEVRAPAACW